MDYFSGLPAELLDEIAYDEQTYRGLLSVPQFARSITIGRRFDFMVKFGHNFHVKTDKNYGRYIHWTKNKLSHNLTGPAVIHYGFYYAWFVNGKCHRVNGPAIKFVNGSEEWRINGTLHREDGPAITYNTLEQWYIHGIPLFKRL